MARKKPRGRELDGILLLNKPVGISSNGALQKAMRLFNAQKGGHTGSLDPLASGMLPICFGEATKISTYLLDSSKAYSVCMQLGVTTSSGDADGEVIAEKPADHIKREAIALVLEKFRGEIDQIPPMYSALKHQGQRLYKLARKGQSVERKARRVSIYRLDFIDYSNDQISLYVECSKGTYIRSLAVDIGDELGCGAFVTRLHRDWVMPYNLQAMYSFEQLRACAEGSSNALDALLLPLDTGLQFPRVALDEDEAARLLMGQVVDYADAQTEGSLFAVYGTDNNFLGVGICKQSGKLAPKRLTRAHI